MSYIVKSNKFPEGPKHRHYCCACSKKAQERFMINAGISTNGKNIWMCKDCGEERRNFGRNEPAYWTRSR